MKLLTKEQQESYENAKISHICKEKFENKYLKDKKYCKVRDHCHYAGEYKGAAHSLYDLKYSVHKEIFVAFHNESNYGNRFIIKWLAYLSIILLKEFIELNVNSDTMIKNVKHAE